MKLTLPELSFVVLIGVSGSGKSTFARKHFKPTEILSSDNCRALVSDDENSQAATPDAFELLHFIAARCAGWSARASATSTCSSRWRRSKPPSSSASRSGTT
jgi:energy-coupling factor transporter ATP-binding protein EcfA2